MNRPTAPAPEGRFTAPSSSPAAHQASPQPTRGDLPPDDSRPAFSGDRQRAAFAPSSPQADQQEAEKQEREVWVRSKSASVQRILARSTESMSPEERTAYSVLSEMIPSTVALQGLSISENGTTVRAEIRNPSRTEWADIERIKSDFRELTGRELMVYEQAEQRPAAPRPRTAGPASGDSFWTSKPVGDAPEEDTLTRHSTLDRSGSEAARSHPRSSPVRAAHVAVRGVQSQAQSTSTEPTAEAEAAAALAGAPSYLPPDLIKYGRVSRVEISAMGPSDSSSSGSATRGRDAFVPRRTQEERDDDQSKRQQQERAGQAARDGGLDESAKERPIEAVRLTFDDLSERSDDESSRRGGSGRCSTCGTELPEQQAQSCPVCAQSGPEVIAKTCTNYRFAGAKFLATVDAFSATEQARDMLAQGQVEPVASLRYQQKLVGHKDLLKFRGESA